MVRVRYSMFIVVILLLASSAFADSIVGLTTVNNKIKPTQTAEFALFLMNNASQAQTYTLYLMQYAQGWNIDTEQIQNKVISLRPGENQTITIVAKPLQKFSSGMYEIPIFVKTDLGESYDRSLRIMVLPEKPFDYLPAIKAVVDMDEKVDPQQPLAIKLKLENKNPLNLSQLKIKIQTDIPEFMKETVIDLSPFEQKTVQFAITPNRYQTPEEQIIFFVFEYQGNQVKIVEVPFEFITVMPEFNVQDSLHKVFFKQFHQLEVKNDGNIKNAQEVKVPISFFQYLFESGEGKVKVENDQRYLAWELTLGPGEITQINYVFNYRILFYIVLLAVLFLIFYYGVKSPVVITKKALTVKSDEKGALSEVKVHLAISNSSSKPVHNLKVIDYVPSIAQVQKHSESGTLHPQEIIPTSKGTKVVWHIAELEAKEHLEVTYKIKAKLNILGTFTLPRATAEFSTVKGKRKKSYTSPFRLN